MMIEMRNWHKNLKTLMKGSRYKLGDTFSTVDGELFSIVKIVYEDGIFYYTPGHNFSGWEVYEFNDADLQGYERIKT